MADPPMLLQGDDESGNESEVDRKLEEECKVENQRKGRPTEADWPDNILDFDDHIPNDHPKMKPHLLPDRPDDRTIVGPPDDYPERYWCRGHHNALPPKGKTLKKITRKTSYSAPLHHALPYKLMRSWYTALHPSSRTILYNTFVRRSGAATSFLPPKIVEWLREEYRPTAVPVNGFTRMDRAFKLMATAAVIRADPMELAALTWQSVTAGTTHLVHQPLGNNFYWMRQELDGRSGDPHFCINSPLDPTNSHMLTDHNVGDLDLISQLELEAAERDKNPIPRWRLYAKVMHQRNLAMMDTALAPIRGLLEDIMTVQQPNEKGPGAFYMGGYEPMWVSPVYCIADWSLRRRLHLLASAAKLQYGTVDEAAAFWSVRYSPDGGYKAVLQAGPPQPYRGDQRRRLRGL